MISSMDAQEIHDLVLSIRKETGWGVGRIKGELFKLGYKDIGRTTINNILRQHGFKPEPIGDPDNTWSNGRSSRMAHVALNIEVHFPK